MKVTLENGGELHVNRERVLCAYEEHGTFYMEMAGEEDAWLIDGESFDAVTAVLDRGDRCSFCGEVVEGRGIRGLDGTVICERCVGRSAELLGGD